MGQKTLGHVGGRGEGNESQGRSSEQEVPFVKLVFSDPSGYLSDLWEVREVTTYLQTSKYLTCPEKLCEFPMMSVSCLF